MARKNKNAGQPNRGAQTLRRAARRRTDEWYRPSRNNGNEYDDHEEGERVLGPGSENLTPIHGVGAVITREVYLVQKAG
jgi:hypothetical protein